MDLQQALKEYEKYFGTNYFHYIGFEKTEEEIIQEIEECIRTGKKQKGPAYDDEKIY